MTLGAEAAFRLDFAGKPVVPGGLAIGAALSCSMRLRHRASAPSVAPVVDHRPGALRYDAAVGDAHRGGLAENRGNVDNSEPIHPTTRGSVSVLATVVSASATAASVATNGSWRRARAVARTRRNGR